MDKIKLRHNDKLIADEIKIRIDALSVLAQYRLDFIEKKGLLQEYFKFLAKKKEEIMKKKREKLAKEAIKAEAKRGIMAG